MRHKKKYFNVSGIGIYIEWYRELSNHTFIVTPSGNYYLKDGLRIPAKTFESTMPIPTLQKGNISKGACLDGRVIE